MYLGRDYEATHPYVVAQFPQYGVNLLPEELPGWRDVINEYISQVTRLGDHMMNLISKSLGLPEDFIAANVTMQDPVVLPRIFHYPTQVTMTNLF